MKNLKNLKGNQVIIFVVALMLVSAGYLNYTANNDTNTISTSSEVNAMLEYAGIGDAKLVNSNGVVETNTEEGIVTNEEIEAESNSNTITSNELIETNSKQVDEYFASSKLTRDTMYSQMIETYEKILTNENISADQKTIAQTEIKNINDNKNKIMICENLIQTKGIKDSVIFVNEGSVSVVVRADILEQEQIAQIQNIINREMQVEINNIHISNKL